MTRAAIYARISQDRSAEALGVRRQEADCRLLAGKMGWTVASVYTDNDVSATSNRLREAYQRMLQDIRAGEIDAVVVWDVDRLTRKPRELEDIIELAERHHTALASVGGEIDLATPQGKLMARIKGNVARHEAEQVSRRAKAKHAELAAAGRAHGGGTRPYGFEADRLTHRATEVAVLREVADRLLNGVTLMSVCQDLTQRGDLTVTGRPWNSGSLRKALTSPRIAGLRQHRNDPPVKAQWHPILDEDTWLALRDSLTAEGRRTTTTKQRVHHWTGLLRCWRCRGLLGPRLISGAASYACRRTARNGGCGGTAVRKSFADHWLDEVLLRRIEQLDNVDAESDSSDDHLVREAEASVMSLERRFDDLADEYASGVLDAQAYGRASRKVLDLLEATRIELRQVRARESRRDSITLDPAQVRPSWPALSPRERRSIAGAFVAEVVVGPARRGVNVFDPNRLTVAWR